MRHGRLYHRIYLSLLLVAFLSVVGAGIVSHIVLDRRFESPHADRLLTEAEYVARLLPPASAAPDRTQKILDDVGRGLRLDLLLVDSAGAPIASTLRPPPALRRSPWTLATRRRAWLGTPRGLALTLRVDGDRMLAVWPQKSPRGLLVLLAVFFTLLALGCLPVARRLTRRLEALEEGFAQLGAGRLSTRVQVQGRDEIAHLAERFNWSAERIERLVEAQRRVLLHASHELRSPLTRVRMALELIRDAGGPEIEARVATAVNEIGDLDALVDDILLASRLEAHQGMTATELDLADLVAEEGARVGAQVEAQPSRLVGDPRLLRRLVRNLLENAARHGGTEIHIGVGPRPDRATGARLWVADRGPGVDPVEQERIFEPFYRGARAAADGAGIGLGLALVRQIAAHHGGQAKCRTRDGGGAWFEVTLGAPVPAPKSA